MGGLELFEKTYFRNETARPSHAKFSRPIVGWLKEHVQKHDNRFQVCTLECPERGVQPQRPIRENASNFSGGWHLRPDHGLFAHQAHGPVRCRAHFSPRSPRYTSEWLSTFFSASCDAAVEQSKDCVPEKPLLEAHIIENISRRCLARLAGV